VCVSVCVRAYRCVCLSVSVLLGQRLYCYGDGFNKQYMGRGGGIQFLAASLIKITMVFQQH